MEFFNNAKAVRLKSHLDKYLTASDDQLTVHQTREGSSRKARWTVEPVQSNPHAIRLKSCYGTYLTASDQSFLLGMTGKKVLLKAYPDAKRVDAATEWEPIKEGYRVRLRTKGGNKYLRANGATPPWRNTVTHDFPHRTATQDWVMWEVEVVDVSALADVEYLSSKSNEVSSFSVAKSVNAADDDDGEDSSNDRSSSSLRSIENKSSSVVNSTHGDDDSGDSSSKDHSPSANLGNRMVSPNHQWPSDHRMSSSPGSQRKDAMEFFDKAKSVRLRSHLGKYLTADEDERTVRQSRNGSSNGARWTVEFVGGNKIRLKSCHGLYLTASDEAFLLGMTGKKVVTGGKADVVRTEWEPVREGERVKLMTCEGKFLRANGGTPPWKNSVTHDVPHRTATQEWVLWGVDILRSDVDGLSRLSCVSSTSSSSAADDLYPGSPLARVSCESSSNAARYSGSPLARVSGESSYNAAPYSGSPLARKTGEPSSNAAQYSGSPLPGDSGESSSNAAEARGPAQKVSVMEFFKKARTVRLRSHHNKYLTAESDEETVVQDRSGSSKSVKWAVEFVEGVENVIRLKSCYGKYLRATDEEFLLGVTGRKVVQALPRKLDSSVEWEPIRDGMQVKLKTRYGNFLRANGGLPPWRNSITHDIPHRHHDWVLWEVDVLEIRPQSPPKVSRTDSLDEDLSSGPLKLRLPSHVKSSSFEDSPMKSEGRLIYYYVADDDGEVNDAIEGPSFQFRGHGLEELSRKLEEETGLEDIILCSRSQVNGKLYPLRLALPPNNATMHVVVIPPTSKAADDFLP